MSLRHTDSNKSLGYRNRKETGCNVAYRNIRSNHSNVACSKSINLYCTEATIGYSCKICLFTACENYFFLVFKMCLKCIANSLQQDQ